MRGTIDDIWDAIEEVVDENIDILLENVNDEEQAEPVEELMPEEEIQQDDLNSDEMDSTKENLSRENPEQLDYWMQEFENMLKGYSPSPKTMEKFSKSSKIAISSKSNKGISPLLLGCGGIFLLGLLTSAAVLVKIKRSNRRLSTMPVPQAIEVEKIPIEEPPPEVKNIPKAEKWPFIRLPGLFPQY
ncbi:hypothetical protein JCM14036_28440 [Desulfotomaculum defluvii]